MWPISQKKHDCEKRSIYAAPRTCWFRLEIDMKFTTATRARWTRLLSVSKIKYKRRCRGDWRWILSLVLVVAQRRDWNLNLKMNFRKLFTLLLIVILCGLIKIPTVHFKSSEVKMFPVFGKSHNMLPSFFCAHSSFTRWNCFLVISKWQNDFPALAEKMWFEWMVFWSFRWNIAEYLLYFHGHRHFFVGNCNE